MLFSVNIVLTLLQHYASILLKRVFYHCSNTAETLQYCAIFLAFRAVRKVSWDLNPGTFALAGTFRSRSRRSSLGRLTCSWTSIRSYEKSTSRRMRDTQYTLYIHQRYRLNGSVDGTWDSGSFVSLFYEFFASRFTFFWNGVLRAGWKSPGENAVCIQSAVTSPPRRPIVSRLIRDVMYREREIRCNESRCHGRIKASG